ncbi:MULTISPECIES: TetR family transcriptional regulator [unclassified Mycolicibacterium]|uniref:TetR family transcriptional regulator n=1 Tax=unclassified Mycolicibacterium TaxID=2636767 RepID=UPI002EDB7391
MVSLRQSQALATRQRLVDVATELFATEGFSSVTTTSLSEAAGVTRGALYHHFTNMTEVMEAVFERAEGTLVADVKRSLEAINGPRRRLLSIGSVVLEAMLRKPDVQRIAFVEAPAALGWTRWRAIDRGRSLRLIQDLLEELDGLGELVDGIEPQVAAQLILGAINEAGMHAAAKGHSSRAAHQLALLCRGLLRHRND